jgi:hypothetical protein
MDIKIIKFWRMNTVAHTCNLSYMRDVGRRITVQAGLSKKSKIKIKGVGVWL